jgi:diguanylate cyclase (GGDEF)-like protein
MALDIRTLLVVLVVCNLAMACALWLAFGGQFRDGLAKWVWGSLVQSAAWSLFAARGYVPEVVSVFSAHTLLVLGLCLHGAALIEFQQKPTPLSLLIGPPALTFIAIAALPDDPLGRVMVSSVVYGSLAALIVTLLARDRQSGTRRTRWLMIGVYSLVSLALFSRVPAWLIDPAQSLSISQPTTLQNVSLLIAVALVLLVSFGFLLMHKERSDEAIRRLATTDPLTGVFNRRTFLDLAERELARCRRASEPLRLLMIDLDHFKRVNDTHGHVAGDEVLAGFAKRVSGCLRKGDLVVRYGGEEFCVLLPGADDTTAAALAERIRATVYATPIATRAGPVHITVSIGICGDQASRIASLDALLVCADEALYEAKKAGRNRAVTGALRNVEARAA